jgi:hypothetical protein
VIIIATINRRNILLLIKRIKAEAIEPNILLLSIMAGVYALAVTIMHSLNCYSEPEVRLYSVFFIAIYLLFLILLDTLIKKFISVKISPIIYIILIFYIVAIGWRVFSESKKNRIDSKISKYSKVTDFLNKKQNDKPLLGFATQVINRQWFARGRHMEALGVFPVQKHHFHGTDKLYTDKEYQDQIENTLRNMPSNNVLIVEFQKGFMERQGSFIESISPIYVAENIYVFKGKSNTLSP